MRRSLPESYRKKLTGMGVIAESSQIYTSALVCAHSLRNIHKGEKTVFVVGEDGLRSALENVRFFVINSNHECDEIIRDKTITVDLVVAGLDRTVTYKKLAAASILVSRGARFYASNTDATLPDPSGLLPGAGSLVSFLITCFW